MSNKILDFIYNFDVIGPSPKLYVFNKERYQNTFSLVLSIIIILVTIAFILYSIVNYAKNDRPNVVYSKSNDINEPREIYLKDMLIMFQITDSFQKKINESDAHLEGIYSEIYDNGRFDFLLLNVNKCKPGENMNIKYEKILHEKFNGLTQEQIQQDKNIEDFYCINSEDPNKKLFHYPNVGYSYIDLNIILHSQSGFKPEDLSIMIIYENNLINHDNKKSPISEGISYQFLQVFSSDDYYTTNMNFQYLKYETDDGLFFDSLSYLKGMSFLDLNYYKNNQKNYDLQNDFIQYNSSTIGTISFVLNKSNYDLYRRTYKKLQALLAEIMSIVSLLFQIGGQIVAFINEKKMNIDIVSQLFNFEDEKRKYKSKYKDRVKVTSEKLNNSFKLSEKNSICIEPSDNINDEIISENGKILKKIYIFHIIKSFICNGNKDKLITLCNELIIRDMCVETILERFYSLGKIYNTIINEEEEKNNLSFYKARRFKDINSIINEILNQTKIRKPKNEDDKYKT